jgi:hypothetical protein
MAIMFTEGKASITTRQTVRDPSLLSDALP